MAEGGGVTEQGSKTSGITGRLRAFGVFALSEFKQKPPTDIATISDQDIAKSIDGIYGFFGKDSFTRLGLMKCFRVPEGQEEALDEKLQDRLGAMIRVNVLIQRKDDDGGYFYVKNDIDRFNAIKKGELELLPTQKPQEAAKPENKAPSVS